MGQRANLALVEGEGYELYYCHWCANTLPRDLFWGPEHARAFIRKQRRMEPESGWLDEVWGEGGAVMDSDARTLLLFGGEDLLFDVPLRRLYLELLGRSWEGWAVRWADEGVADLADYVGVPRERVLVLEEEESADSLTPPEERDWTDCVGSVVREPASLTLYPLCMDIFCYLNAGPKLLHLARKEAGWKRLPLEEWLTSFPVSGFHLDVPSRTLEFWTASDAPEAWQRVARRWPGWTVQWHRDRFEFQLERTQSLLTFPTRSRSDLESQMIAMLMADNGNSPAEAMLEFCEQQRLEGKEVEINPDALHYAASELSRGDRQRRLLSVLR